MTTMMIPTSVNNKDNSFPALSSSFVDDEYISYGFLSRVAREKDEERELKRGAAGSTYSYDDSQDDQDDEEDDATLCAKNTWRCDYDYDLSSSYDERSIDDPRNIIMSSICDCIYCKYPNNHAHCINCSCGKCNDRSSPFSSPDGCEYDVSSISCKEKQYLYEEDHDCEIFGLPETDAAEESIVAPSCQEQTSCKFDDGDNIPDMSWDPAVYGIARPGNPPPSPSPPSSSVLLSPSSSSPNGIDHRGSSLSDLSGGYDFNTCDENRGKGTPSQVSFSDDTQFKPNKLPYTARIDMLYTKAAGAYHCPINLSLADYELRNLLERDIASLKERKQTLHAAIAGINDSTVSHRSELLRTIAVSRGDAKDESFLNEVEALGQLRTQKNTLEKELEEVERLLERRKGKLLELVPDLEQPEAFIAPQAPATKSDQSKIEGKWYSLTNQYGKDCIGYNDDDNPLYRLGRMAFEMFMPGDLVCAIQAVFNPISEVVGSDHGHEKRGGGVDDFEYDAEMSGVGKGRHHFTVPKALREEVRRALRRASSSKSDAPMLRSYNIVTAFTIEPFSPQFGQDSPNKVVMTPIRGILTTEGYALSDPNNPDRLSVWFSGGKIECGHPKDSHEFEIWRYIFGNNNAGIRNSKLLSQSDKLLLKRRSFREGAFIFAARLMLGASGYNDGMDYETGEMRYSFSRPIGGHGKAFVDIIHMDENIRVMRGNAGTVYALSRV